MKSFGCFVAALVYLALSVFARRDGERTESVVWLATANVWLAAGWLA